MLSICVLYTILIVLPYHVYGRNTVSNQELIETEKEERTFLIEIPLIGSVMMVAFKVVSLVVNAIGPFLEYKMAAVTLIANLASWLHQNVITVLIGSVVILGFCVITGIGQTSEDVMDHRLVLAARQLETGALKYARMVD